MISSQKQTSTIRIFYGWYVLGAAFLILFFNAGARNSLGVIFKPMIADFGWNRSAISLAYFLNTAVYAFSLTVIGQLYDRYGPKWIIIISTLCLSLGFILIGILSYPWQFFLFYGVIAAVGIGGTSVPIFATLTSKWFERRRGLAISIALSGNSVGQFALVPLMTFVVVGYGWRESCILIGCLMLVVNIVLVTTIIKGDPVDLGILPFGATEEKSIRKTDRADSIPKEDLNLGDAMRTPSFWYFTVTMFICGSADFMIAAHLIPLATDNGISPITAGNMLAWCGLMSFVGILIAGPVSDKIGNKIPLTTTFLVRVILFLLILKVKTVLSFYVFSIFFGITFLVTAPLTPLLIGRLYGLAHLGVLSGFITTVHHLAGGFWAYVGGVVFDRTGNYQLVFVISAIMASAAFLCCLLIKEERHQAIRPR